MSAGRPTTPALDTSAFERCQMASSSRAGPLTLQRVEHGHLQGDAKGGEQQIPAIWHDLTLQGTPSALGIISE